MRFPPLALFATVLTGAVLLPAPALAPAFAMNLNLASPYDDVPSPPQTALLSFFSRQTEDLLFTPGTLASRGKDGTIEIICQAGLRGVALKYSLHRNMVNRPFREGLAQALPANQFRLAIPVAGLQPGFYDVRVTLDSGAPKKAARPVTGVCVFGWKAGEMALRATRPADFGQFWAKARAKMAALPLDARVETPPQNFNREQIEIYNAQSACLPPDYDPGGHAVEAVESAKVSFAGPDGGRVYGWMAKPAGAGPFPAMLVLPGAGFNARPRPLEHARHGYLALDIQIHGQDVDLAEYPKLPGYYSDPQFVPVDAFYYYKVHLRVLQALNYLASRPDVDPRRIVVVGGSQGGRLGIVAAGLDHRVRAVVACIANSPNYPHLAWIARCNGLDHPGDNPYDARFKDRPKSDGMDLKGAPPAVTDAEGLCAAYYDPMNFAPDVQCPVLMNGGLIDPVSPPSSVWAVFNQLKGKEKTMVPLPGLAHDWSAEFDRSAWRWLSEHTK